MANKKHLAILEEGVGVWNQWRKENPEIQPDLSRAILNGADLTGINLSKSNLQRANLSEADLNEALLNGAQLDGSDLYKADLYKADLRRAHLRNANLNRADLNRADFSGARLNGASLRLTTLNGTNFYGADLAETDFSEAMVGGTYFGSVDLSEAKGLDRVIQVGPSTIGIDSLYRSRGEIPETFLRGVGIPDIFIKYLPSLTNQPLQFYSCFISYSSEDESFTKRLYADLQREGVRCWYAPEDLKIGEKLRPAIDQSIRVHDKLLLLLSQYSINSNWVESEVESALNEERKRNEIVLFPVRLDDVVMKTDQPWAAEIRRTRHIGDFTRWKAEDSYQLAFERLLRDLKMEG